MSNDKIWTTTPASGSPEQKEYIESAANGFERLLGNDIVGARAIFSANKTSAAHGVGLGITAFLQAALGLESGELSSALDVLVNSEAAAQAAASSRQASYKTVYPNGTEYSLLVHDAVMAQALVHILAESYLEFMKATWKLNKAYKGYKNVYQIVFPGGISDSDSLDSIVTRLNTHYRERQAAPATSLASGSSSSSWSGFLGLGGGRKKHLAAGSGLKHSNSSAALKDAPTAVAGMKERMVASEPVSREGSVKDVPGAVTTTGGSIVVEQGDQGSFPAPEWAGDPLTTLVISGASFGMGLFGLIFSILPPKARKLISWFGFHGSRQTALKLLTVAASTGSDVHGYFASLSLLTFYCLILLMSGWQAEEKHLLDQCTIVLDRVIERFPNGTLWILNRAKLCRMRHKTEEAIEIIEDALVKAPSFREADSLLVFELSWLHLSSSSYVKAADSFCRMCELNSWSHSTYLAIAAGCLIDVPKEERTPEIEKRIDDLCTKLPTLIGGKRMLGEPPTTEIFITRRLAAEKVKLERWIATGRLPAGSPQWRVTRITFAYILGCFWATIGGRSPPAAIEQQIAHLASFSPAVKFGPHAAEGSASIARSAPGASTTALSLPTPHATDELDTVDEVAMRDLLLGALYRSQNTVASLATARQFLDSVVRERTRFTEEKWVVPFALFELAVVDCKEGDLEEARLKAAGNANVKSAWKERVRRAEKAIEEALAVPEYDMKGRLESRCIMLRDEIATKKVQLGL